MKKVCNKSEELCPRDEDIPKHEYCEASKVCYDKMPSITGIYKDILLFAGIIINAFSSEGIKNYFKKKNKATRLSQEQLRNFQQAEALKQGFVNIHQQQGGNKYLSKKKKKKVKKNRIKKSRKK